MSELITAEHRLAPDDNPLAGPYCICGSPMSWEECSECGGEGYHEMYESDPLWYDQDDIEMCEMCLGKGGYYYCWKATEEAPR